ncbi:MAG: hypothetical protein ACKE51_00790 [Methylococcaceae bacterium]
MIIILAAIITVVMFYHSGKNKSGTGIKWAIIGLIGFILGFSMGMAFIGETFISVSIGCIIVFLTHTQLARVAEKNKAID